MWATVPALKAIWPDFWLRWQSAEWVFIQKIGKFGPDENFYGFRMRISLIFRWEFLWFSHGNFYDFLMRTSMIFWWKFLWFSDENFYDFLMRISMIFWWVFLWFSDGFWNLIYFSITSHRVSVERNVKWFNEGRNTAWMSLEIVHKYH